MSGSRDSILGSLRASLAQSRLPLSEAARLAAPQARSADLVAEFSREVRAVHGAVHGPLPVDQVGEIILRLLRDYGAQEILSWNEEYLAVPALEETLAGAGVRRMAAELPEEPQARKQRLAEMERAGAGLTGARGGLADTGTIVVASGAGRARLAWLLPPVHIALLPTSRIYPTLAAFLVHATALGSSSHLALVTGPSRTADIELTLTRGVHGPKELQIVLVAEKGD
jgi:L-lactate dehydrogenase complex protein LldG